MNNTTAAVLGSFMGDALSLGSHWNYDPADIKEKLGEITQFTDPASDSYHPNKTKGQFTHYGDQEFVLLQSLAANKGWNKKDFTARFVALFDNYQDYIDHATNDTLSNIDRGVDPTGSSSSDFSAVGRIAPLLLIDSPNRMASIKEYVAVTHNNAEVIESAVFFAKLATLALQGHAPKESIKELLKSETNAAIVDWIEKGLASLQTDTTLAIQQLGPSCPTQGCFPSVIHCMVKYQEDFRKALSECVQAGGDSAARASVLGMVLGAYHAEQALPTQWRVERQEEIIQLMKEL